MKEYTTIANKEVVAETVIEKSRFIASAIHADSVEKAVEFVNEKRKQYFDATHNCYAYVVGDKAKFSDDGEPQGTAGMPIYECLKNSGLDRICVVVTRYFGGIKLGAGGLVRAYNGSCAEVLKRCEKLQMTDCTRLEVEIDYSLLKPLRRALQPFAVEENVIYDQKVTLVFLFPTVSSNTILDIVVQNTLGKAVVREKERVLCHFEF
ncbi:MAG: YigZ family protein [Candidatus Fimimonas sp.]